MHTQNSSLENLSEASTWDT